MRNNVLNANTWSRNQSEATKDVGPFRYNQYGYNIGGPAYIPGVFNRDKNKFFFFWGQEWLKYRFTDSPTLEVPTLKMRNGDFSELLGANPFYKTAMQLKDPEDGSAHPGKYHSGKYAQPEWFGHVARLSYSERGFHQWKSELDCSGPAHDRSAQRYIERRYVSRDRITTSHSIARTTRTSSISHSTEVRIVHRSSSSVPTRRTR